LKWVQPNLRSMEGAASPEKIPSGWNLDRALQVDMFEIQMTQERRAALFSAYLTSGVAFEVFSITLILTAALLDKPLPVSWLVLMVIYLAVGIGFFTFGIRGFGNLRRIERKQLADLKRKYVE
jgi:uncharacterized membrane protein